MTDAAKTLRMQARKLSPAERIELVDDIFASLDELDPAIDRLWAKEAEERLAACRRGEIKALPLEEVLAKYRTMAAREPARIVQPPPPMPGRSAVPPPNIVVSVVLQPGEDVEWTWTSTPDGGSYVSGYTIVSRDTNHIG